MADIFFLAGIESTGVPSPERGGSFCSVEPCELSTPPWIHGEACASYAAMPLGRFLAITNLLLAAFAYPALAQTPKPPSPPAKPAAQSAPLLGTAAVVLDLNAIDGVLGKSVKSYKGEDMGHVVDVLVTPNGQSRAAVIDFGGMLGVGSRKVAVDWKTLSFTSGPKGPIILALTRDQVRVAPEYKTGDPVVVLELSPSEPATPKAAPIPTKPDAATK